ncbi:prepilin-type N-terminal cleavage/methylation domain-containing protein [Algisphaera agarilytica]|uniref:Prepilin-type N-terminal cleavage/methylation domain-containing protein/prepilin-type processing-associated H-X9-DG protein n=1 Tax=Algisphaera agarilytica TaxID=1385975 RepID=A0A7X0H4M4_9BACT|nr:prepilin-type N-terminal cleavage/methylation domain-containing protein [Algisphaera agarilytica]MBB6428932.1 prepilin-type N-terminal cleavage/methylation domain-containing protein/prepilin-type processing-associated H-X9-DG protein [Algisphaera agarilytica]
MISCNDSTAGERPATQAGFSLIELLVALGIIALLLALLLPALRSARRAAHQTHCSAQIAHVGKALEMHANDHKELYPTAGGQIGWGMIDPVTGLPSWMEQIDTYMTSREVFSGCHEYPTDTPYHYFLGTRAVALDAADQAKLFGFAPVDRARVRHTSAHILGGDNNWRFENEPDAPDKDDYTQETLSFTATLNHWEPQHSGGLNIMFVDGHVAHHSAHDSTRMTYHYQRMTDWWGF